MRFTPPRRRPRRRAVLTATATAAAVVAIPAAANAAVVATYSGQTLTVLGDSLSNDIVVSRDSGGKLLVNSGAVPVLGGTPTVANTALIQQFGQAGGDVLRLDERKGPLPLAHLLGGDGNDFMVGGSKVDLLFGQAGDDTADGARGDDFVFLGDGIDKAQWSLTSGSDQVFGGRDHDRVRMVGTPENDNFSTSATGTAANLVHNRSAEFVRASQVEEATLAAARGADDIKLGTLATTALRKVSVDLAAVAGGATPDGERDRITVVGDDTAGDVITVAGDGAAAASLGTTVTLRGAETALDKVDVTTGGGGDVLDASALPATSAALTLRGGDDGDLLSGGAGSDGIIAGSGVDEVRAGAGNDNVIGEAGVDTIDGGAGDDTLSGGSGEDKLTAGAGEDTVYGGLDKDIAHLGAGNDRFATSGGHGSDTVEGEDGFDLVTHAGTGANERLDVRAFGRRARLVRDIGAQVTDTGGVERFTPEGSPGRDTVAVGNVSGTALEEVDVDLGGEGPDHVSMQGTIGADTAVITGSAARTVVNGLRTTVQARNAGGDDTLEVRTLEGVDQIDASAHNGTGPRLTLHAGFHADTVLGSGGNDVIVGGLGPDVVEGRQGNDTALLGDGDDRFAWTPGHGSDLVEGEAGRDRLTFTGSNASESFSLTANGGRALLTRNVASIVMDVDTLEEITVSALGGPDTVKVGDLTATGVTAVAARLGAGDAAPDRVDVDGTNGDDRIALAGRDGSVTVSGLEAATSIFDAGEEDRLEVRGLGGADSFDTSALGPIAFGLSLVS